MKAMQKDLVALRRRGSPQANEESTSDSGAASTPRQQGGDVLDGEMSSAVQKMIKRLDEYEKAVDADRLTKLPTRPSSQPITPTKDSSTVNATAGDSSPGLGRSSPPSSNRSWIDLGSLKDALENPREGLLKNLERVDQPSTWSLPAGASVKIAGPFLVKTYSLYGSAVAFSKAWIKEKDLHRNHIANEMTLHCLVLDKMVKSSPDFVMTEGCEMLCRRIYGLKRAFREVKCGTDWKQPKGPTGAKWKSKVRWDLANEIDLRALQEDDEEIPELEQELQTRLKDKALMAKALGASSAAVEDEDF